MKQPSNDDVVNVAIGSEASRRVAWARFYKAQEDVDRLLQLNSALEERLAELVILIAENEALTVIDPDGELIMLARQILGSLQLRPRGQAAVRRVKHRRETP